MRLTDRDRFYRTHRCANGQNAENENEMKGVPSMTRTVDWYYHRNG